MKVSEYFDQFMEENVDLNKTRIATLEQRVTTIKAFISNSDYRPKIMGFSEQGSWAHRTIVRPPREGREFDADLVVYVQKAKGWEPADYINKLWALFHQSGTYCHICRRKTRCVTLDYAGDFHLDIVPIVVDDVYSIFGATYAVCNRSENRYEPTDGEGFKDWFANRNKRVGDDRLVQVVRLLKYIRDTKQTFTAKSVLLTTLIAQQVDASGIFGISDDFEDLPTSLYTVLYRLNDWLDARPDLPEIPNPALRSESFARNWTQEHYENFRNVIARYSEWASDALVEQDVDKSLDAWRKLLGPEFARGAAPHSGAAAERVAVRAVGGNLDIVELMRRRGRSILQAIPQFVGWMKAPPLEESGKNYPVLVRAWNARVKGGEVDAELSSGDPLASSIWLKFEAFAGEGRKYRAELFDVAWQVVNTGEAADMDDCLRGGFEPSTLNHVRWEKTQYHGAHWVQAFLINKNSNLVDGKSARFFVVVD